MAIQELIEFMPPPDDPVEPEGDWSAAEAEFGVKFPTDFKRLIHRYGTGEFMHGLAVFNPLTDRGRKEIVDELKNSAQLRDALELPLVLHPERPGLLPWGRDDHGHQYFWWTKGRPGDWPVFVLFHEDEEPFRTSVGVSTFLVKLGRNEYADATLKQFAEEECRFERGRLWDHLT